MIHSVPINLEFSNSSGLESITRVLDLAFICFSGASNLFGYCRRFPGHHKLK